MSTPGPDPAWLAMLAKKKTQPRRPGSAGGIVPGECRCPVDAIAEDGQWVNPWVFGHRHWCPMFMVECADCGMHSGTHKYNCKFWDKHPTLSPF